MSSSSPLSLPAEKNRIELIVGEFFTKAFLIVVESRIPLFHSHLAPDEIESHSSVSSSSSVTGPRTWDRWFNLAIRDIQTVSEELYPWRRGSIEPMIVDIILSQPSNNKEGGGGGVGVGVGGSIPWEDTERDGNSPLGTSKTVLERWVVQFDKRVKVPHGGGLSRGGRGESSSSGSRSHSLPDTGRFEARISSQLPAHIVEVPAVYKRAVIMTRSIYSMARLLPAYRLFRLASSSSQNPNFSLSYRVSPLPSQLSSMDETEMRLYEFSPVETVYGWIRVSVRYCYTTSVRALEVVPPICPPRIISDYVGSPNTDPLKFFSTNPLSIPSGGSSGRKIVHMVSRPSSLPNSPFGVNSACRHNSWSGGVNKVQPMLQPPSSPSHHHLSLSPSLSPRLASPYHMSPSPLSSPSHLKFVSPTEGHYSPPFPMSPSPSPPTSHGFHGDNSITGKGLHRCESAPVKIPEATSIQCRYVGNMHQHRGALPPLSPKNRRFGVLSRVSSANSRLLSGYRPPSSGTSLDANIGAMSLELFSSAETSHLHQGSGSEKAHSALKTHVPPQALSGRRSSNIYINDDDDDFSCPFAVDYEDLEEHNSRSDSPRVSTKMTLESPDSSGHKSQKAAVGALYSLLRSAQPLRANKGSAALSFSTSISQEQHQHQASSSSKGSSPNYSQPPNNALITSTHSGFGASKTIADALEELKGYKEMRDGLLSQSGRKIPRETSFGSR